MKLTAVLLPLFLLAPPQPGWSNEDLPDIGSPADAVLSKSRAEQIGRMIVRQLRDGNLILDDPEISEYIQSIGHRLGGNASNGDHEFSFFVVSQPSINAFALPGGYIGMHSGLILATNTESELAGVLAHEVAHVTQKHLARRIQATSRSGMAAAAAMLAAILVGITTDASSDAMQAAVAVSQGMAAQQQINYTRSNEYEADRVGIGILAASGYDPNGMPTFFETMQRRSGPTIAPEILLTHPVSTSRIAESRGRVAQYPQVSVRDSVNYQLAKARLRVLLAETPQQALEYFERRDEPDLGMQGASIRYGKALALMESGRADQAAAILEELLADNVSVIAYHTALGQAQLAAGRNTQSLATFSRAIELFPRNTPLTIRYSQALLHTGSSREAHLVLLDLLNNIRPTADQARLLALTASAAGDTADAHYYMSEYHVLNGNLPLAADQLRLALAVPNLDDVQRARFAARLAFIREFMPKQRGSIIEEPEEFSGDSFAARR